MNTLWCGGHAGVAVIIGVNNLPLEESPIELDGLAVIDPAMRAQVEALIDRRVAEGTKRATETILRNLNLAQEGGRIGMFDINLATGDASGSPVWAELLGQGRDNCSISRRAWIKLLHPNDCKRVLTDITTALKTGDGAEIEYRIILQSGEVRCLHSRNLVASQSDGSSKAFGMLQDITERKALEAKVLHTALHDELTGLPNRRSFMEQLAAACKDASNEQKVGLALYDLDFLKQANDRHGHDAGDLLLKTAADRLQDAHGDGALVARLGGDEFAVLLRIDERPKLRSMAEKSLAALSQLVTFRGSVIKSGASGGGAIAISPRTVPMTLFRQADQALLHVKQNQRGEYLEHRGRGGKRSRSWTPPITSAEN